ncbi:oligosaccharide flippase family protein [Methylocystis bryophila]|uniref:Polysaccharide biosynthesis protein C-terminal domain-containing protein n=1 Tax=Methylocystis bryophila TaxID=655015 RepID=A0A1W6MQV9_9HYPH|nr:oligosaccharide flippase family protein [Methylocystis bryophila]ARN79955.1 hypothetical protein B1812_01430 [Methylocystis bryophila]BDV39857.1 O-antigen translocase [Methylocystis bryophila]
MSEHKHSYGQILRSSSIVGGAQAINYAIGLVRVKVVALLIGPAGVGFLGAYTSAIALVGAVSDFGASPSAIREIATAHSGRNAEELARTFAMLRRILLATGAIGWALAILFCSPLSEWMTGSREHAWPIAIAGSTLLINSSNGVQASLLQGVRRIGDYARSNLIGAALSCVATIAIFLLMGESGIVPSMIAASVVALSCSAYFSRRVALASVKVTMAETWACFRKILGLSLAMMWNGILWAGLDMTVRSLILRQFGADAAGNYQAAWTLTGVFANVVLAGMASDFYPRLVGMIGDRPRATRVINQQTEIGVLLSLPSLLFAASFAPYVVKILYSSKFDAASELLTWMAFGVFFRLVCWPMWYVQLAKAASYWFAATQTISVGVQAALTLILLERFGVVGAAYAYVCAYMIQTVLVLLAGRKLIGASWEGETAALVLLGAALIGGAGALRLYASEIVANLGGGALCLLGAVISLRGLAYRLGDEHRLIRLLHKLPGARLLFPSQAPAIAAQGIGASQSSADGGKL